jgi:cobalt-zinc-cadmium efflux system protein
VCGRAPRPALAKAHRESLNVEGAFQHNLMDAFGSIGAAVAAAAILIWGFERADPIASLAVAALMLRSPYGLLRSSGRIFMEVAPEGVDPNEIGRPHHRPWCRRRARSPRLGR